MLAFSALDRIPDTTEPAAIAAWATKNLARMHDLRMTSEHSSTFTSLDADGIPKDEQAGLARFSNAALLADWACYQAPSDRADIPRLQAVIAAFPRGFRVWFCRDAGAYVPVGYTGWYPIGAEAFAKAHSNPSALTHRRELWPEPDLRPAGSYLWLFNYSIVAAFRKSDQSRRMLRSYAADLLPITKRGLAAAVLSDESKRVAARFGMTYRGDMSHDGVKENIYTSKF